MDLKNSEKKVSINYESWEFRKKQQLSAKSTAVAGNTPKKEGTKITRFLEVLMTVSLFALFFGLPLFFLNQTFQGIIFEKQVFFYFWVLVGIISWVVKSVLVGEIKIKKTPLDYLIVAFVFAYFLSTIFSVDRWHSFFGFFGDQSRGFVNVVACVLVYYFIVSNFTKRRLVIALGSFMASVAVVEIWTVLGIFFAAKLPQWVSSHVPVSPFGSMTSLGIFLSLAYPLFVVSIYKISEASIAKKLKITLVSLLGLFLILDVVLIWLLYSFVFLPGILPGLVVGISFFAIFIIALIVRPKAGWAWISIASFMAVLLLLLIGGGDNYLPQKLPAEVSPSYGLSWNVAKEAMKDKFFIGTGTASYGYDFSRYRPQELNNTQFFNLRFYQGSGLFLEALPTIGFLGTVILVLILLSYLGTSIYLLCKEKEKNKMYSLGIFSAGVTFLYSAFTIRVDGAILLVGTLVVILSLAVLQFESSNEEEYLKFSLKASPKYALALAFVFMLICGGVAYVFVFAGKALLADMAMKKATTQNSRNEDGSIKQMVQAINLYPKEARYYIRTGQEYMVLANGEALKEKDQRNTVTIEQYLNNAITLSSIAKELAPNDVLIVEGLAQIYENSSMFVEKSSELAEQYYQRALELEPHNPVYYIKLGEMKIARASISNDSVQKKQLVQEAIGLYQKSVESKKDYAVGYYYIAIASEALGDMDKAIEAIKSAITNERTNMDYIFTLANLLRERGKSDDYAQAEQIYKGILAQDNKQYNVHLALGILFEKEKKNDEAIVEYKKILTVVPEGNEEIKIQINKMISNVQSGEGNLKVLNAKDPSSVVEDVSAQSTVIDQNTQSQP